MIPGPMASTVTIIFKDKSSLEFDIIISTFLEDGFLKIIDKNHTLHAFNADVILSY